MSKQTLVITRFSLLQTSIFLHFHELLSFSLNFSKNIKQLSYAEISNLKGFCRHYFVCLVWSRFDFGKLSTLLIDSFMIELIFLSQMSVFPRNLNHSLEVQRAKEVCSDYHGHNILELYIFQFWSASPQIKRSLISRITNLTYEFPHELLNDFRFRIV